MKIYLSKPGIISSAGDLNGLINAVKNGERKLSEIENLGKKFIAGQIDESLLTNKIKNSQFSTRTNQIAYVALMQIKSEIDRAIKKFGAKNIGAVIATTTSGVEENFKRFNGAFISSADLDFDKNALNNPARFVADFCAIKGPAYAISNACTSGIKAISEAAMLIKSGICKAVIAGGADSINSLTLHGFKSLSILSDNFCEPCGKNRDGTNLGEGAAFFIVSGDVDLAKCELLASSGNCDAFAMTTPRMDGFYQSELINECLKMAGLVEPDYINLHATATLANDAMEAAALKNINAPKSGIKQYIGHTLGAAGAIEMAFCAAMLGEKSHLYPHKIDGEIDSSLSLNNLLTKAQIKRVDSAMNLSFAFGGDNACAILGRLK